MRIDKFTDQFRRDLAEAQSIAISNSSPYIEPKHLLLAIVDQSDSPNKRILLRAGVDVGKLKTRLRNLIVNAPKVHDFDGEINISRELSNQFNLAEREAESREDKYISGDSYLLVLSKDRGEIG